MSAAPLEDAPRFEPEALLAAASVQAEGLSDFGDPRFRPALDALCAALEGEAHLSPLGRQLLHHKLLELLVNRLRIEDWFKRHPQIDDEVLEAPLVIIGMMRTGTTLLQRVLSCDPQFYSMAWWETRYPVPFPGESLKTPNERIERARGEVRVMVEAMPKLMAIHPMDADQADEEVMLMEHSFYSAMNSYADIPSYMRWLAEHGEAPAYDYLKRVLKFLQWQKRQRGIVATRWVLKTPHHMLRMHLLLDAFPGAKIIQCHRDPLQTIPSTASFIHTLWQIYGRAPDPLSAGASWNDIMRRALAQTQAMRNTHPGRFFDVDFRDTVKRPFETVRAIYDFAGLQLGAAAESAMQRWLATNPREARAAHDYDMAVYGLSEPQLKRDFADYRARYIEAADEHAASA